MKQLIEQLFERYFILRDKSITSGYEIDASDIDYQAFEVSLKETVLKELIEEIKKINSIITWRHCQDNWHLDYHKVLADANTAMKLLLDRINQ